MKKIAMLVIMVLLATGAFAQQPWAKSYNKDGQFNIYGSVGYWYGLTFSAGAEYIIGEFKLGNVPIDFGVMVRGAMEFYSWLGGSLTFWGAAPLFTLHLGLADAPFEFYVGAGLGLYGYSWSSGSLSSYPGFGVGFATVDGVIFHVSKAIGIIVEIGYIGATAFWGGGVEIQF